MSITTKEIADKCGLSRRTVERALNGHQNINSVTKEKIITVALELGYRPNLLARSLVIGRSMSIGVVVFDLYNRFFAQLVNSIEAKAKESGYFTYIILTDKDADFEKNCINHLACRQVDGLILCSVNSGDDYEKYLKSFNIPIIAVGNRISADIPFVGIDDYKAMAAVAEYVVDKGYEKIIYFSPAMAYAGKTNIYAQERRYAGFYDVIKNKKASLELHVVMDKELDSVIEKIADPNTLKTAIVCSSDIYAIDLLSRLKDRNVNVPGEVGLIGFDNIDVLKYISPALATVSYPIENIGSKAVECLICKITGKKVPQNLVLPYEIIPGQTI